MSEPFDAVGVIVAKRDRRELSDDEIRWVIDAYTRGVVADEQMSALAMAVLLNGMTRREVATWTAAMIASGERMDFSSLSRPTADKHSTGGVGDKITLPLAPLVAVFGVAVPQLSGRGLGHTGGTLDKLESIPGWRASLSNEEMLAQLDSVGAVICAAGSGLAPADKKLYALRDVTGTVEAIPLIASSIMSKKIAEGTGALVLDVKVGSGAFMKTLGQARELAETMVDLGTDAGVRTVALLTNMDTPLGLTAGNALEVRESVDVLAGGGPQDVVELTIALADELLQAAGRGGQDVRAAQGGDPDAALPVAQEQEVITAPASGIITALDAYAVGIAAWRLGAGRARKEDVVQAGAGVVLHAKPGDTVRAGEPLVTLHTDTPDRFARAIEALTDAWTLDGPTQDITPLLLGRPAQDAPTLARWFRDSADSGSLELYLETFSHTVAVMQTADQLHRVARECALDLAADGVVYAESRFAPELHLDGGLSLDAVVDAVLAGFRDGEREAAAAGTPIRMVALLTAMRHAANSTEIARLAVQFRDRGVGGFDIAGAEAGFPPTRHLDAFEYLRRENFHFTIHAGEAFGLPSIWEMAPSSNLQTGAAASIAEHPITLLKDLRFRVTINTDNRLISGTSMSREMQLLVDEAGWTLEDLRWATINALKSAFIPFDERLGIIDHIVKPGYAALGAVS